MTIPITMTNKDGASAADYSGVPDDVTFNSGDTEKSFTFSAAQDSVDDGGHSRPGRPYHHHHRRYLGEI